MRKVFIILAMSMCVGHVCAQQSYCVENDITHAYLNDFSYDTLDLSVSYVMKYFNMPHDYRLDAPQPVRLSWTHEDGAEAQRVEVSESAAYSDSIVFTIHKDSAQYNLYNMIPGRKYYYRIVSVKAGNPTVVGSGQIEPTGMLRMIVAEGTWNVRDMGGWTGLGGYPLNYGKIFRGAQLIAPKSPYQTLVTANGIEALRNAGIRAELDLRSSSQAPSSVSALAVKDASGNYDVDFRLISESVNARMLNFDKNDANIRELQWIINELKQNKPVYYHCQNGADRTGTLGFLIGALLGMGESDLAKDYELTTFCEKAAAEFDPTEKGFARLRNYEGKKGSPLGSGDNADEYKYAKLVEKMRTVEPVDGTYQQKIYNFFKTGVNGTKISEADLNWFIDLMINPIRLNGAVSMTLNAGETYQIDAVVTTKDGNPDPVITFTSSDPSVATVSGNGLVTGVRGGEAVVMVEFDGFSKSIKVTVPLIESVLPDAESTIVYDNNGYKLKGDNIVKNGSFEYAASFFKWEDASGSEMSGDNFAIKYYEGGDSCYIESKADGDESSSNSIKTQWKIAGGRTYVFGYRVKNSTDLATVNNENLKVSLVKSSASMTLEYYPSYDGNWKEVQYVFTNPKGTSNAYRYCQILFTHLSQDGNNTCFDNFYLAEVEEDAGYTFVGPVRYDATDGNIYDLNGRNVGTSVKGFMIQDGKIYLNR